MKKQKTIWIINEYAGSPYHGMEFRHFYLAKILQEKYNYNVVIISASFSHLFINPPQINKNFHFEKIDGINYVWIKVPKYESSSDKRRVLKWFIFSLKLGILRFLKKDIPKPDIIIASTPEIFHLIPSCLLAKHFNAKFIYEIRDIWPLSLVEIGNISPNHPLIKLMRKIELFTYRNADAVISVLDNIQEYFKENNIKIKNLSIIPNGICLKSLKIEPVPENIKNLIPKNKFIVGYAGSIGKANALEFLIKAADLLRQYKDIVIVIVGKGEELEKLKTLVKQNKLNNVFFLPPVKKTMVYEIIKNFDIAYIGWRKKRIYKYGISANKIFDYMYMQKPILHSYEGSNNIVQKANCGISVEAENPQAIAEGILKLYKMSEEERKKLGANGKQYLLENHTYEKLALKLKNEVLEK